MRVDQATELEQDSRRNFLERKLKIARISRLVEN